jgi:integrase
VDDLSRAQRPKPGQTTRRRLHSDAELSATLDAAGQAWKAPLALIAATGVRESEALALTWDNLHLDDDIPFAVIDSQLSRATKDDPAERVELKTEESIREVAIPKEVVRLLKAHKLRSRHINPNDYVFATCNGLPISQRNLLRELDRAQRAAVLDGEPLFRTVDEQGRRLTRRAAGLPTIHGMRHTFASRLVDEGESVDEVAWTLGHKDGRTTRAVYVRELRSAEQRAKRLARTERGVKWMASPDVSDDESTLKSGNENIAYLEDKRITSEPS